MAIIILLYEFLHHPPTLKYNKTKMQKRSTAKLKRNDQKEMSNKKKK